MRVKERKKGQKKKEKDKKKWNEIAVVIHMTPWMVIEKDNEFSSPLSLSLYFLLFLFSFFLFLSLFLIRTEFDLEENDSEINGLHPVFIV